MSSKWTPKGRVAFGEQLMFSTKIFNNMIYNTMFVKLHFIVQSIIISFNEGSKVSHVWMERNGGKVIVGCLNRASLKRVEREEPVRYEEGIYLSGYCDLTFSSYPLPLVNHCLDKPPLKLEVAYFSSLFEQQ